MCRLLQTSGGGRVLCFGSALPQGVFQVGVVLRFTSLTSVWPLSLPACRCKYCSVKLGQIFFVREDKPCCSKCHREAEEECWVCKKKISDDHIYCNKKFYHPKCMKVSKHWVPSTRHSVIASLNALWYQQGLSFHISHRQVIAWLSCFYQHCQPSLFTLQCHICGDVLKDRYLTFKDQPVCEKDFKVRAEW